MSSSACGFFILTDRRSRRIRFSWLAEQPRLHEYGKFGDRSQPGSIWSVHWSVKVKMYRYMVWGAPLSF